MVSFSYPDTNIKDSHVTAACDAERMSIVYVAGTGVRDNCKLMRVPDGPSRPRPALAPHHRKAPLPPVNTKVNTEITLRVLAHRCGWGGSHNYLRW